MRVLLVPELYRPDDAPANGTLNDLVTLVERWLAVDPSMHVSGFQAVRRRASASTNRHTAHRIPHLVRKRERTPFYGHEPTIHPISHESP